MAGSTDRNRCVLLTGLMGAGKSRVGRALAESLDWRFIDTDAELERAAGMKIAELFAREGEVSFRARERAVLEALPKSGCVVALGGGAVVAPENRSVLRDKGALVWLDARAETLVERIGDASERPLLAGLDRDARIAKLEALRANRAEAYGSAEIRIDTDARGVEEICAAIKSALAAGAAR